jgi:hypothetical protein
MTTSNFNLEEIEIEIDAQGQVQIWVKGVDGPRCLQLTSELEAVIGNLIGREMTSDYYLSTDGVISDNLEIKE